MELPAQSPGGTGPEGRISVELGGWTPPEEYQYPQLEPNAGIRTVEHDVLADSTIVQKTGESAQRFVLRGDGFADDVYRLRYMRGDIVEVQHPVFIGEVLVENVSAESLSAWEDKGWVYNFTVDLIEVVE